jgi:chromosome segregation ATPase
LPETLLDRIEEAQQQIDDLKGDISLLQTEKKALDLISRNLSKIRHLTDEKNRYPAFDSAVNEINGRIRNLLRINRRVESIRFKGHPLLKNNIIQMNSAPAANLYLRTTKIPEIEGVETGDMQATRMSLDDAARAINEQYQRLRSVMRQLLEYYQQLQSEIDVLILAQARLHQTDD